MLEALAYEYEEEQRALQEYHELLEEEENDETISQRAA